MGGSLDKLLIIATHARMLAQAARDSGFIPVVVDCYGDQDTQQLADYYQKVNSLSLADLAPIIEFFKQQNITQLVYGSGFESHSDSLIFLARHFEILGNSPETFIALQDKRDFFQRLQKLNINHPEVCFTIPKESENWLIKPQHSQGGLAIQYLSKRQNNKAKTTSYYQRYIKGEPLSVLFLANGKQAQVIGFNRQLTTTLENQPFVFAGIVNHAELSTQQQQTLTVWVNKLTTAYGLRGLNSLDFILSDDICYVLEINPRPPASMQLYNADLLTAHINACCGQLMTANPLKDWQSLNNANIQFKTKRYKAYQILYAQKTTLIPEQIQWPNGCVDIPSVGAIINKEQPICSIIASGKNLVELLDNLQLKKSFLSTFINLEHDAIQSQR